MERLINKDFAVQRITTLDLAGKNNMHYFIPTLEENNLESFNFDTWNCNVYEFIQSYLANDRNKVIEILERLFYQLKARDDLIAPFLEPIENSDFYKYSLNCLSENDDKLNESLMKCFSYMSFVSSDFVKSICVKGIVNCITCIFKDRMDSGTPYAPNVIIYFFNLLGNICMDDTDWLFQMVQLGLIPLCKKILLSYSDINVIGSVVKCLIDMFSSSVNHDFLNSQISALFHMLKVMLASILLDRSKFQLFEKQENSNCTLKLPSDDMTVPNSAIFDGVITGTVCFAFDAPIEHIVQLAYSCFLVFENYGNNDATVSILLKSNVPQFCYEILNPQFPMIFVDTKFKNEIINHAINNIKIAFRFGPCDLLKEFIQEQGNINILYSYIDSDLLDTTINALTVIGYMLHFNKNAIFTGIEIGLFDKILQMYYDADFQLKATIAHVIAAAINNGVTSVITSVFLKSDVFDILTDSLDTPMSDCRDEVPTALNILSHYLQSKDDNVYSIAVPFINEMPDIQVFNE